MLLLCALIVGSTSAWAEETPKVTLDFTSNDAWELPLGSGNGITTEKSYSDGTYSITLSATTKYYFNSDGYLMLGKSGSTLTLPAFSFDVYKIVITGKSGASADVKQNIFVGENAVSTETKGAKGTNTYEIAADYQAAGNIYVLKVTSAHNTQISKIEIYEAVLASSIPTPTLSVATNSAVAKGTKVTITNLDTDNYAYFFTTDGTTPTYDADSGDATGTTTAYLDGITINSDCTVKVLATDYSDDSDVATYEYTLSREEANLVAIDDFSLEVSLTKGELYTTDSNGAITFESSDATVATVSDAGVVTAIKPGTATITINQAMTEEYAAAEATVTVTVTAKEAVAPVGPAGSAGKFVKVTDNADLKDGDYLIVYEDGNVAFNGALTTLDAANNGITISFEADGSIAETTANKAAVFTLNTSDYSLMNASGKYIGVTTWGNGLKQADTAYPHNAFTFDSDGNVTISITIGTSGDMILNYNSNSSDQRFRYYKNGSQKKIQLYKYVAGTYDPTFDVTVSDAKWRTMVSSKNVTLPTGLTAYIVTASSASSATLTAVSKVKANTAVLLNGNADDYTLTVTEDEVTYSETNLLKVSTETTGNGVYVLANGDDGVGFYQWTGGSLGAGRVYLDAPASGARAFLAFSFEDEATGINTSFIDNGQLTIDNTVYNLNGQRVAQPAKGLYIVNGRKVIFK